MRNYLTIDLDEHYCSIDISKSLRDIGFNCKCDLIYDEMHGLITYNNITNSKLDMHELNHDCFTRPTIAMAIEWISIAFGINIQISPRQETMNDYYVYFYKDGEIIDEIKFLFYKTKIDASDAALRYIISKIKNNIEINK